MNLTDTLVLVVKVPPIIDTLVDAQGGDLDSELTDHLVGANGVLSPDFKGDVIADVLDVDFKHFLPGRALAFSFSSFSSELLHASHDLNVGIHGGEGVHVTGNSSLMDVKVKNS